jgi:hypothetical protein
MTYSKMRRPAKAGLAMSLALLGSVLIVPASSAAAESTRVLQPGQSTLVLDDGDRRAVRLRPFEGSGTGEGTVIVRDDGKVTIVWDGSQRFTHLGRSTWHAEAVCTNPECTSSIGTTINTSANGDTLIFVETVTEGVATFVITGGTGRFQGATGSGSTTADVAADPNDPLKISVTFESLGTIAFGDNLS